MKNEGVKNANLRLVFFILLAFGFSVLCRFYWIYWASDFNEYFFNNELMISSNDGYTFAEGARDKIAGFHQENDLSFINSSLSILTYVLYKITPFSFESIILYMSVFFSSLIVVPLLLISNELKRPLMGLFAAFLASIAKSYYNRTMAGYYDTDMLAIVLPMFILYFFMRLILRKDAFSLLALPFFMGLYLWWYPSSYTLNIAFIALFVLFVFVFHRKEKSFYIAALLCAITLSNIAWFYQSAIIVLLFALFILKNSFFNFKIILLLALAVLVFLALSGGIDPILYQLKFYLLRSDESASLAQGFAYFNVNLTIQEVESVDLRTFMQRISGSELVFLLSIFGLIWLIKKHKVMLLALPMLALGFLALRGGLRFTIYAVPIMALGFGFLSVQILTLVQKTRPLKDTKFLRIFFYGVFPLFVLGLGTYFYFNQSALYESMGVEFDKSFWAYFLEDSLLFSLLILAIFTPLIFELLWRKRDIRFVCSFYIVGVLLFSLWANLSHIYQYRAHTVFSYNEAAILDNLKHNVSREDYIVAWWDYGYPIRYYSDVKTLADGGKHLGKDNFFPSFVLSKEPRAAANMARLSVEYTEKSFKTPYNDILEAMMKDYNYSNVNVFLAALSEKDFELQTPKTRDIYIYMPSRMAAIFGTVASFSYMSLETGELENPFVYSVAYYLGNDEDGKLILSNNMLLHSDFRSFELNGKLYNINSLVEFTSVQQKYYSVVEIDKDAKYYLFHIKDANIPNVQFILMDKAMFESAFVQMFFFGKFDESLYELIVDSKEAKVYKLKL
ncbi:STT3 domain-containing protein [Campylobacter helveticus]|uniref:STT3 domain-containing protein n=1 Tax=Campylobacter helveticus TaxID=28898 RepID=UPI00214A481D|nr:STT3 domain-containing protein [Campylobacter helveticus]MCR2064287.1 peptide-binding protein [Campylobacter helveticus]